MVCEKRAAPSHARLTDLSTGLVGAAGYGEGDDLPVIAGAVLVHRIYEQMVLVGTPRPSDVPFSHGGGESEPGWTSNLLSAVETRVIDTTATPFPTIMSLVHGYESDDDDAAAAVEGDLFGLGSLPGVKKARVGESTNVLAPVVHAAPDVLAEVSSL